MALRQWGMLETLLHEQVHLWQQNFGEDKAEVGRVYHNREFVDKCESFGLHPKLGEGYHLRPADGVFAAIMKEHGIEPPAVEVAADNEIDWWKLLKDLFGELPKGRSTLARWSCPDCGLNVRVGVKRDIEIACMPCSRAKGETVVFRRA